MRILITNNTLDWRAGTELYVFDIARELQRRGHRAVAFSQRQGAVAASLRDSGIAVVDDPRKMGAPPDVIHGHHHLETLIALTSFPGVPAINFCHGWEPWQEAPLRFPRVLRYVAVDQPCWEKLVLENGIPAGKVERLLNFVDTARFPCRSPLLAAPRRALAFGNYFLPGPAFEMMRRVCLDLGIQLDAAGLSSGSPHSAPERLLAGYDLVFAKARSALEAMAVGAAVILCGPQGLGPMVSPDNWRELRSLNFGFRGLNLPYTAEEFANQIRRYDPEAASGVRDLVRREATLTEAADRLCGLYEDVVREGKSVPPNLPAENAAVAPYLLCWAPKYKQWEHAAGREDLVRGLDHARREAAEARSESARRMAELESARQNLEQARAESAAKEAARDAAEVQLAQLRRRYEENLEQARQTSAAREHELNERMESLIAQRDHWRSSHDAISRSATWRLVRVVLQSWPVRVLAAPLLERLGRLLRRDLPDRHG